MDHRDAGRGPVARVGAAGTNPPATEEYRRLCGARRAVPVRHTATRVAGMDEHGGHCRFKSRRTGQIVEAPLREWVDPDRVDPYFFAMFVRSTTGLEPVAELLTHDFHDAARVLDVVEQNE